MILFLQLFQNHQFEHSVSKCYFGTLFDEFSSRHRLQQRGHRRGTGSIHVLLRSGSSVSSRGLCHSTRHPGDNDNDDIIVVVVAIVVL